MILVTGAAGQVGIAVIRALAGRGQAVRAFVRTTHGAERVRAAGADDIALGDMTHEGDLLAAARGVKAICHISPSQGSDEVRMGACAIAAAKAHKVTRIVYFGSVNLLVQTDQHRDKRRVEAAIVESQLPYTFLHPCKFMQGILPMWQDITQRGLLRVPYSVHSPIARVDLEDVGDAAAAVLLDEGHLGATYELIGQPPISEAQIAATLAARLGGPVRAETVPAEEWAEAAATRGMDPEHIRRSLQMFDFFSRLGSPHESTYTLGWLIGRPPADFSSFAGRLVATGQLASNASV